MPHSENITLLSKDEEFEKIMEPQEEVYFSMVESFIQQTRINLPDQTPRFIIRSTTGKRFLMKRIRLGPEGLELVIEPMVMDPEEGGSQ